MMSKTAFILASGTSLNTTGKQMQIQHCHQWNYQFTINQFGTKNSTKKRK